MFGPENTPWVRESIYKKKDNQDLAPNPHTAAAIRKEVLPTPPPKKGGGGRGLKIEKFHRGIIFCPTMMIYKKVGHPIPQLGVCYVNDPNGGAHDTRFALDLTLSPR